MTSFVLDVPTVLTWCFSDEQSEKAREISEHIAGGSSVFVPAFWRYEILNALLVGERRKRIAAALLELFLLDLNNLPIALDEPATPKVVYGATRKLCRKHGLGACDAAYPEIARRKRCALAAPAERVQVL